MSRRKQQLRAGVLMSLCALCVAGGYGHAATLTPDQQAVYDAVMAQIRVDDSVATEIANKLKDSSELKSAVADSIINRQNMQMGRDSRTHRGTNASTAYGEQSLALGEETLSAGYQSLAAGDYTTALGDSAKALGFSSVAVGGQATAAYGSTVVGYGSYVYAPISVAVGIGCGTGNETFRETYKKHNYMKHPNSADSPIYYYYEVIQKDAQKMETYKREFADRLSGLKPESYAYNTQLAYAIIHKLATEGAPQRVTLLGAFTSAEANGSVALGSQAKANRAAGSIGYNPAGVEWTDKDDYIAKENLQDKVAAATQELQAAKKALDAKKSEVNAASGEEKERLRGEEYELQKEYDRAQGKLKSISSEWIATWGAVSVGNEEKGYTRQITNLAAGTEDTDAVNVAQLKALANAPVAFSTVTKATAAGQADTVTKVGTLPLSKLVLEYADGLTVTTQGDAANPTAMRIGVDGSKIDLSNNTTIKNLKTQVTGNKIHYLSIGPDNEANLAKGGNYNNDGADSHWGIAIGVDASSKEAGIAMGKDSRAWGNQSVALGSGATGMGDYTTALGHMSDAYGDSATAIGAIARAYGAGGVAMGEFALTANENGISKAEFDALPEQDKTLYAQSALPGQETYYKVKERTQAGEVKEIKNLGVAIGSGAQSIGQSGVAIGNKAKANADWGMALGVNARVTASQGVALGVNSVSDRMAKVKGYLPTINAQVDDFESAMAAVGKGNEFAALKKKYAAAQQAVAEAQKAYDANQADAGLKQALETAEAKLDEATNEYAVMTGAWVSRRGAISIGNEKTGFNRQLTGLAAGSEDTDAVNVAQLKALDAKKADKNELNTINNNIQTLQGGFTIQDANTAVGKADVALGEKTKDAITFKSAVQEGTDNDAALVATVGTDKSVTYTLNTKKLKNALGIDNLGTGTMSSWKLKASSDAAGTAAETIADGNEVTFDVSAEEKQKGLTVTRTNGTITYGINHSELVTNIAGDIITEINKTTNTQKITNVDWDKWPGMHFFKGGSMAEGKYVPSADAADKWRNSRIVFGDGLTAKEIEDADGNKYTEITVTGGGTPGTPGAKGEDGKSAFDIWKEENNRPTATKAEFLEALKGADGTNGTDGKSVYDTWKEQPGNADKTQDDFLKAMKGKDGTDGKDGKSAYQVWKEYQKADATKPNADKTEADFMEYMKGKGGAGGTDFTVKTDETATAAKPDTKVDAQNSTFTIAGDKTNITTSIGGNNTVKVALKKDITVDSVTAGGVKIDKNGIDAGGKKVTHVAAGDVSKDSTDAVTGGQLFETNQTVASINQTVGKLGGAIADVRNESREGDALNAALAALKPLDFDPLQRSQIMAGVSTYKGKQAVALGLAHYSNEDTLVHAGVSYAGSSELMANAGISWRFGDKADRDNRNARAERMPQYAAGPMSSVYVMQDEMTALKAKNDAAEARIAELEAENKASDERIAALEKQMQALLNR